MEPVMMTSSVNGDKPRRARSKNVEQSTEELKILADFERKVAEKVRLDQTTYRLDQIMIQELRKNRRIAEDKQRALEREKKKREMEQFQQEIDKMLNDDDDDEPKKEVIT